MHPYSLLAASLDFFGPIVPESAQTCAAGWASAIAVLNNIIKFALSMGIIIAVLMIAYAGFLWVTNPINAENRTKARSILMNAGIGLLIALGAWLLVNTLLGALSGGTRSISYFTGFLSTGGGDTCIIAKNQTPGPAGGTGVTAGNSTTGNGTAICTGTNGSPQQLTGSAAGAYQYSSQISALAQQYGVSDQTNELLGIIAQESGGKTGLTSGAGAIGLMQLMPATAAQYGVSACQGSSNSNPSSACVAALKDASTNMTAAVKYYATLYQQNSGNVANAIAGYNGGQGANRSSNTCPGQTYWQCAANDGYAETRNYVTQVSNYANTIGGCGAAGTTTASPTSASSNSASSNGTIQSQTIDLSNDSSLLGN
jgi:hypothetical protein